MSKTALAVLAAGFAATPALAQYVYNVQYVPDFDQKRTAASGVPGLPGDGGMYCVPTSVINWFAYFANRGITQPAGLNGPRVWQSQVNYNLVTTHLSTMGALMGTDPSGGTNGNGGLSGAMLYSLGLTAGAVNVFRFACSSGDCPTPDSLFAAHLMGAFVAACYGYYDENPTGAFTRDGGHCITIVGGHSAGSSGPFSIDYRDPASDGYNSTQSIFMTHTVGMAPTLALFRGSSSSSWVIDTRYRLQFGSTPKFLDSWYVLMPTVGLTAFSNGTIQLIRPIRLLTSAQPETQLFNIPAGVGALRHLLVHPTTVNRVFFTTAIAGGAPVSRLFQLDPITGQSSERLVGGDFRFMEFDRFGHLIICDGSVLKLYDPTTNPPTLLNTRTFALAPRALACDDSTSTIGLIVPTAGGPSTFVRLNGDLSPNSTLLLPANVNPLGNLSLAFSRAGDIFLCGDGTPAFYQMAQSGGTLSLIRSAGLVAPNNQPTGLNVSDAGHVLFSSGGAIREYELDANNRWVVSPSSLFAGRPAGAQFFLLRSRTNHDPALHEGPGYVDVADPEIAPGVPDCYANCDGSTIAPILNVNDFICFQNLFATGRIDANCDESTTAPVLNVNDFICFQNKFAQGCR
jgi:hypothetical protein